MKFFLGLIVLCSIPSFAGMITKEVRINVADKDCLKANVKLDKAIKLATTNKIVLGIKVFECNQQSYDNGESESQQSAQVTVEINSVLGNY